jgi:histidinol-phosphate aminotransferase
MLAYDAWRAKIFGSQKTFHAAPLDKGDDRLKLRVPVPANTRRMSPCHVPIEGRLGALRLDFNENTVGSSAAALRAVRKLTAEQLAMYPEYSAPTARIARWFDVKPNELTLANGADGALQNIVSTFVDPQSAILLVNPTFVMYHFYAQLSGARMVYLRYDSEMRFPVDVVMKALRKSPRLFLIANPNNPTGSLIQPSVIRRMLDAAPHTLFVLDEAYAEFSGVTVLPWIRRYPNLIVVRTFSKGAGLAGLRLGCIFACPEVTALLGRTREPFSVNAVAMVAAEATLRDYRSVTKYAKEIGLARELLRNTLIRLRVKAFPSAANFLLVDFGADAPRILRRLARRRILLRDRTADFGRVGYVRITIGTRLQMRRLIRELERAILESKS